MGDIETIISKAATLLREQGRDYSEATPQVEQIVADGSTRSFIRLTFAGTNVLCVLPSRAETFGPAEAHAFYAIGHHLQGQGIPVPALWGVDVETNMVVCEDLGNTRLHDLLVGKDGAMEHMLPLYEEVVRVLAHMQVKGGAHFDPKWCWDTPCYDTQLMVEKESGYFLRAFCQEYLNLQFDPAPVKEDCLHLAQQADRAPKHFFLHRDFQSRNLMVKDGKIRIIDFQGGRLGPLAYDLASLLIDPYAGLDKKVQSRLVNAYLDELHKLVDYDPDQFHRELATLSVQRNLQVIGAYAFLTKTRGKPFFKQFLKPALGSLLTLLELPENNAYQALHSLTRRCQAQLNQAKI